jgi:flotillin
VVLGGGVFVWPFVQRRHTIDLSSRRISVQIRGAVSKQGIKLNLDGVAIVKVGGDEHSIRSAAQRFLSQQREIENFTTEVLSGALRSIIGGLTVEEVIRDRAAFATKVSEESEAALTGQGLVLDTFQIQDVTDDGTYLQDLGRPEAARIQQAAAIAEALARQEAEQAKLAAEQQIALSERDLAIKRAEIKSETDAALAQAAAAGPLAEAARQQDVLAEQEKVAVRQAALTDRELDTAVRKPADAERYRVETDAAARRAAKVAEAEGQKAATIAAAEASKAATIAAAEAEATRQRLTGEGEKSRRAALADATRLEGEAEGAAIAAKGSAEAEAMHNKANAFREYGEAATLQMLVEMLPHLAKEIAAPMGSIDNLTVVSTDGAGALPKQVTGTYLQTAEMIKATTGVDLSTLLAGLVGGRVGGLAAGAGAEGAETPRPRKSKEQQDG